jgi:ATP-dependent exoDNAse (exonuclease V) beta subunit
VSDQPVSFAANEEQQRAIDASGLVFVSAGAGTGKTRVLVERFARAVLERELAPDRVLAITYTERAAAELVGRIRVRLAEEGRPELARALDGAWISTIHAFCTRVLRRFALQAGLDPAFGVLDGSAAEILRAEAYATALEELADADPDVLDVVTAYGEDRLRTLIDGTHERLRTAGNPLRFAEPAPVDLPALVAAAVAAARSLAAATGSGVYLDESRGRAALLVAALGAGPDAALLAELGAYRSRGRLEVAGAYDAAVEALERGARDAVYAGLLPRLDELLGRFAATYHGRKRAASMLDFDDLQLEVRRLLTERDDVRGELQARFAQVMVDEFQDTNELQCAIVDAVTAPTADLFFVGDEFQSIYRFRNADVAVFRRRHAGARETDGAATISLTRNYRSRPGVLAVVNHLFGAAFGAQYEPLTAGGTFPELGTGEPAVEFLVTTNGSARAADLEPREAEAGALAARLRSLVADGLCSPGEIVLLFSAGTDADIYEEALIGAGFATASATGRRYFEAQPVRDVVAYLRLVRNRYDDAAFLAVVASPLVGVSNDTLAHLRFAAPKKPLFAAVENGIPSSVSAADGRLLAAFRQRFDRLVEAAGRVDLGMLIERVIAEHDYDLALLAHPSGARRTANVRKLVRIARDFEALRGPDLEGFLTTVEVRRLAADREAEALTTEEGTDAVRLMTVHSAKGLQFPVVVVADAGRAGAVRSEHLVALPDGRVGVKVPDAAGQLHGTTAFSDALVLERRADDDERRRVSYVALTRAIDRLIVSGCVDEKAEQPTSPIGWMLQRLGATLTAGEQAIDVPGGSVAVRVWERADPAIVDEPQAPVEIEGQLAFFTDPAEVEPLPPPAPVALPAPLTPLPPVPAERPGRLSFSSLHLYERCGYRFGAERLLGFRPTDDRRRPGADGGAGLDGAELGTVVHDTLEHPGRDVDVALGRVPHATPEDRARALALIDTWNTLDLAGEVAALGARREVPFLLRVAETDVVGFIDLLATGADQVAMVVDYKTNRITDRTPEQIRDADYALQETVYALALLDAGAPAVAVHFAFLDAGRVVSRTFTAADRDALRATVAAAITATAVGPYVARPGVVCHDCPVLGLLCAGPDLDSLHAAPDAW